MNGVNGNGVRPNGQGSEPLIREVDFFCDTAATKMAPPTETLEDTGGRALEPRHDSDATEQQEVNDRDILAIAALAGQIAELVTPQVVSAVKTELELRGFGLGEFQDDDTPMIEATVEDDPNLEDDRAPESAQEIAQRIVSEVFAPENVRARINKLPQYKQASLFVDVMDTWTTDEVEDVAGKLAHEQQVALARGALESMGPEELDDFLNGLSSGTQLGLHAHALRNATPETVAAVLELQQRIMGAAAEPTEPDEQLLYRLADPANPGVYHLYEPEECRRLVETETTESRRMTAMLDDDERSDIQDTLNLTSETRGSVMDDVLGFEADRHLDTNGNEIRSFNLSQVEPSSVESTNRSHGLNRSNDN